MCETALTFLSAMGALVGSVMGMAIGLVMWSVLGLVLMSSIGLIMGPSWGRTFWVIHRISHVVGHGVDRMFCL